MECKSYYNLQDLVFIWRLQILVCAFKLTEFYIIGKIYGNLIYSILLKLNILVYNLVYKIIRQRKYSSIVTRIVYWENKRHKKSKRTS